MDMDNPGLTRESKLVLGTLVLAATVMLLNETTLSVALPVIMDSFGVTAATAQWLTTGFMLTMAVVIPTTGFVIERLTTRQVFITAFVFFLGVPWWRPSPPSSLRCWQVGCCKPLEPR